MDTRTLRNQIVHDLRKLKDRRGFLCANTTNYDRLFGRDALIASWQLLDWNAGICKATLEVLAQFQGEVIDKDRGEEPGKILHEHAFGESWHAEGHFPFPYYGTVDATPLFCIVFAMYYRKTGDLNFLKNRWEYILKALYWMEEYGDADGDLFLEYEKKAFGGLYHQGWKDSFGNHLKIDAPVAIVEAQGYQYLALREVANLAAIKRDDDLADQLTQRAEELKRKFNEAFWMPEEQYFALGLDGDKNQRDAITSNPGHLLFTGIVDEDKIEPVVRRLFADDLWTAYGIRTHSVQEPDFDPLSYHLGSIWPHDNWIIAAGLQKLGRKEEYEKIKKAILHALREIGYRYMPEYYGVRREKLYWSASAGNPQAWVVGALFNFLQVTPRIHERIWMQVEPKKFKW